MLEEFQYKLISKKYAKKPDLAFAKNYYKASNTFAIQPRGGIGRLEKQNELMHALELSGADFLPITVDSHTRLGDFERASALLDAENIHNTNILNGFPICSHNIEDVSWMVNQFCRPVCLRHGTAYPEHVFRSSLNAGITEFEGGALSYVLPYSRRANLVKAIQQWTEVDILTGKFNATGIDLSRESFGPLSATLVPPIMIIVTQLAELTLAVVCGVKSYTLTLPEFHNLTQTILCKKIIEDYKSTLIEISKNDFSLYFGLHQWMSVFPNDEKKATALIATSASFAANAKFDKLITKTAVEALKIPDMTDNCSAVELVDYVRQNSKHGCVTHWEIDPDEIGMIKENVDNILSKFFSVASGISNNKNSIADLQTELLNLVLTGQIDIPFAPHEKNRNKLVTCFDQDGAVRILNPGDIELTDSFVLYETHQAKLRVGNRSISEQIQKDIFVKC